MFSRKQLIRALILAVSCASALAFGAAAGGPYVIHGKVYDLSGNPIPHFPMRLNIALPVAGVDNDNVYYPIPNYDDHLVYTDENGEFIMTDVIDYPENTTHTYRIEPGRMYWSAWMEKYPFIRPYLKIDLSKYPDTNRIEVEVRPEPAAALKIIARDKDGRPYNGTLSISIDTGTHRFNNIGFFRNGLHISPGIPLPHQGFQPKVALLARRTSWETQSKRAAEGKPISMGDFITDDAFFKSNFRITPHQFDTIECDVPVPFAPDPPKPEGPFTLRGQVTAAGQPLPGLELRLFPIVPGGGVDRYNVYYRVPGRNEHRVVTDAEGRFTMAGVVDYEMVTTHNYRIVGVTPPGSPAGLWRADAQVDLGKAGANELTFALRATPCAALEVRLRDRNGELFTGTRAVYVGFGDEGVVNTLTFERGVALRPGIFTDRPLTVAVLDGATAEEVLFKAKWAGERVVHNPNLLKYAAQVGGRPLVRTLQQPEEGKLSVVEFRL